MMMGIALLFVIGLGFSAVPTQQSPSPEADLAKARAKWTAGHVSSYEFDSRWRTLFERLGSIDKLFAFAWPAPSRQFLPPNS